MQESDPALPSTLSKTRAAWAAVALAAAAAAQIALERWSFPSTVPDHLFRGRVLPALLWVAAVPLVMGLGARFPVRGRRGGRALVVHGPALAAWLFATNLLLRLPDVAAQGWAWVLDDTRRGMVRFGPAAVLLWLVLAWLGRDASAAAAVQVLDDPGRPDDSGHPGHPDDAAPERPPADDAPATLPVPGLNRVHLVALDRIRYLEADGDHVRVHTVEGELRMRATLSQVERRLAGARAFVRIHRSHLVNVGHLREVQPFQHGDWVAVMSDGAELRIPRTRRRALERILGRDAGS